MNNLFSSLNRERYSPIFLASFVAISCCLSFYYLDYSPSNHINTNTRVDFLVTGVSLGAIWAGFIGVLMGLFMTLTNTEILEKLKDSGYISDLHEYLIQSIKGSVWFSLISFIGFFFIKNNFEIFFSFWLGSFFYAGLTFLRATNIAYNIMKHMHK